MTVTHVPPAQEKITYEEHDGLEYPFISKWVGGAVVARNERGHVIGHLRWYAEGYEFVDEDRAFMIDFIKVERPYQRLGIATRLLREAQKIEPRVRHSNVRTEAGDVWAKSTGDPVPVRVTKRWNPYAFDHIVADVKHIIEHEASYV